jgi:hypothetical protein
VKHLIDAIATCQLQATGSLQDMGASITDGRAVAIIDIEEDISGYNLPGGAAAQVAVLTPYMHHLALLRRISCSLIRIILGVRPFSQLIHSHASLRSSSGP